MMSVKEHRKRAFLIPVHQPKTGLLVSLLNSIIVCDGTDATPERIVLIVSDWKDLQFFTRVLHRHPIWPRLDLLDAAAYARDILNSEVLAERIVSNIAGSVVNTKKLIGLHWMMRCQIDFCVCIDCDSLAVRTSAVLFEQAKKNHASQLYIATRVDNEEHVVIYRDVTKKCGELFNEVDEELIKYVTCQYNLYTWFYDVPAYELETVEAMFVYMAERYGSIAEFISKMHWPTFDHIVYTLYRIISKRATIFDATAELGVLNRTECITLEDATRIFRKTGYMPAWLSAQTTFVEPDCYDLMPSLAMLMHMDR